MYPLEGATGGGDKLTLKGSNLAEVRRISGVEWSARWTAS